MSTWQFVLAEPGGGGLEIQDLDSASDRSVDELLMEPHNASFSLNSRSDEARMIALMAHDVKLYRSNELRTRMRIATSNRSIADPSTLTFTAFSYKEMLNRKKLYATDTAVTTGYSGVDIEEVAWNLINAVQSRTGGLNAFNITRDGTATGRTVTGTRRFQAGQSVAEAIDSLLQSETTTSSDDSVEWDIIASGDDLVFTVWYPRRGKSAAEADYTFDNRSTVLSGSEGFDPATFANHITVQGNAGDHEMQNVNCDTPTSGTFTLSFKGQTTSAINWNASLETILLRLEALSTIGSGNVAVTGSAPNDGTFYVRFIGTLGYTNQPLMTASSTLVGSTGITIGTSREGSRYTATVTSDDYDSSPYGRIEAYVFDEELVDQASVDERANYLKKIYGTFTPRYEFDISPSQYEGASDVGLGDYVVVDLRDEGYDTLRTDLRVSGLHFDIGDDGEESISVDVEIPVPIDRTMTNLKKRVAIRERAELIRQSTARRNRIRYIKKRLTVLETMKRQNDAALKRNQNAKRTKVTRARLSKENKALHAQETKINREIRSLKKEYGKLT